MRAIRLSGSGEGAVLSRPYLISEAVFPLCGRLFLGTSF